MSAVTNAAAAQPVPDLPAVETGAASQDRSLVLHEGIHDPTCERWPARLRLKGQGPDGVRFVKGRCRATNLCGYCARLAAVETTEMLWLDAMACGSPPLWSVLTTRGPLWDGERWMRAWRQVVKAVRLRWPGAEYAALVEFTTGYGPKSGGKRRPHMNVFWRGVPVEDADVLRELIARVWCGQMPALPQFQTVDRVHDMRGLTRYVALHFQKESQAPPKGWSGHRFRSSRGYFVGGAAAARQAARESLSRGRALWKAGQLLGWQRHPALEMGADYLQRRDAEVEWELVKITAEGALAPVIRPRKENHATREL